MGNAGDIGNSPRASQAARREARSDLRGPLIYESFLPAVAACARRIRHELVGTLGTHGVAPGRTGDVALLLSEAATNVVLHAYSPDAPGPIYASAALPGRTLAISIVDFGHGIGTPSLNPGGGFGLPVMTALADDFEVCANHPCPGTAVHAVFADVGPAGAGRPSATGATEQPDLLREYVAALEAAHRSVRDETDAVLAQARQALVHARRCRRDRACARR